MIIRKISKQQALRLIVRFHYSKVMPKLNKLFLGGFVDDELVAVITFGWGVRPLHTIRKLFPSLGTEDYWEIGKMCLDDKMPKNSESQFIKQCLSYIKKNHPQIKLIFTWADGMVGKPGYVYQASNFLYGGFIWTDSYFTDKGEKVHPRTTGKIGGRPDIETQDELGFKQYFGKQFRYVYFLCSNKEKKRLLKESTVKWGLEHPKHKDLCWKCRDRDGKRVPCLAPYYNPNFSKFNDSGVKAKKWCKENPPLSDFISERSIKSDTPCFQQGWTGAIPVSRINNI